MTRGQEKKNVVARSVDFATESWDELKKVHPPTKQETIQVTILVVFLVVLFGAFLGLTDKIGGEVMKNVLT